MMDGVVVVTAVAAAAKTIGLGCRRTLFRMRQSMCCWLQELKAKRQALENLSELMLANTRQIRRANVGATRAVGEMIRAVGEMIRGEMNRGEMNRGEMNRGEMNRGEMIRGEMKHGEMKHGEMNRGEMKAFRRVKRLPVSRCAMSWSNCCRAVDAAWLLRAVSLRPRCVKGELPRVRAPKQ